RAGRGRLPERLTALQLRPGPVHAGRPHRRVRPVAPEALRHGGRPAEAPDPRPSDLALVGGTMGIYLDRMFNLSGAAVTSLTAMNFGTGSTAGPYSPQLNGRLLKITCILVPQAATSLAQHGRVEFTQTNWHPNTIRISVAGFGLAT